MNTRAFTIWMTGMSGAGKSTIAALLAKKLAERGLSQVEILDGDDLRRTPGFKAGFSKEDRDNHIRRVAYICHLLTRNGVPNIVAVISPYRETRDYARKLVSDFLEVFVDAPIEVLEARDPKGLYRRAKAGAITQFTGVSDPYEPPEQPEVICRTDREDVEESVASILAALEARAYLAAHEDSYSPEEEAQIQTRLRNLGYL